MNCIEFAETPFIPLSKWTAAYQWSQQHDALERKKGNTSIFFASSSKSKTSITPNIVTKFE